MSTVPRKSFIDLNDLLYCSKGNTGNTTKNGHEDQPPDFTCPVSSGKQALSNLQTNLLVSFYRATIESVLVHAIPVWYAGCSLADRRRLQRVTRTAERVIGCLLPPLDSIASSRCLTKARSIIKDHLHPDHHLFIMLPSGRRFRSLKSKTNRLRNSFFPWQSEL